MKTNLRRLLALIVTLAMVLPLAAPALTVSASQDYAYEGSFSDSTTAVEQLPEGWVRHPYYKNGTVYQKDGALYLDSLTAAGVCAAFFDQSDYTDYMVEADFTMVERKDDNRWMGITYRANTDENAVNNFVINYKSAYSFNAYYGVATTGYDGSVINRGWNTYDGTYFATGTPSATNHPELVGAAQSKVNLKIIIQGGTFTGFVNGVQVLQVKMHNELQADGSFGIVSANTVIKVENFKVTDLTPKESPYAYEAKFSESTEEVAALPEGWVRHPNYKNGTITQKDGALYFNTKTASGICAALYEQSEYSDYLIEADFTMLDRTNDARWMGLAYRTSADEAAVNMFFIKYNNAVGINAYYSSAITCYDGTTMKGWGDARSISNSLSAAQYPELVNAGKGTVNLKLRVVGDTLTGYVNDVKVLETTTYNSTQDAGSFGVVTSNADIKVENYRVIDLTQTEEEIEEPYAYVAEFANTQTDGLPTGWKQHPNYRAGAFSQNNGAFYFTAKTASGIGSVYYDQSMYHDYLVEADFTMEDKTDVNRWMGFSFRMNGDENSTNMFAIKYNNTATFHAYYGVATQGYDGSTLARGWAPEDGVHFLSDSKIGTTYPELAGAGAGKVNLKMGIVGGKFYGFVNNIKVLEAKIHNEHQALGSFGIATANANIKVENYRVIDLTELNNEAGASVAHGITLPASGSGKLLASADLGNYVASTTVSFGDAAASTAKLLIAKSGDKELYANVCKDGTVTVTLGDKTLMQGTATIADTANVVIKTVYANGSVKVSVDGTEIGYGFALTNLPAKYGYILDGNSTVNAISLNQTSASISSVSFRSELTEVEFDTTPDWSKVELICQLSDGTVYKPAITSNMITGFDPKTTGTQTLTLTYTHGGKTYTEKFNVTVKDDPANIPNAKVGIITDVHIGADASNGPALEKALTYYKNKGVDAIVCVGDIGHDYSKYLDQFEAIYNTVFPDGEDGPEKFFVMGNHDTYCFEHDGYPRGTEEHNNAVESYFAETFDCVADYGRVGLNYAKIIKGYVFVGLYIQTPIEERVAFLEQMFALPEAQGKPVFIVQHEIPLGSIYIEKPGADEDELHQVLVNYPNAVMLTGHSHNPLADERALWQGEYTAVSCGSLFGPIVERDMYEGGRENGSFQDNNWSAKAGLYMELRDAGINIERYDFTHDEKLGKDWFIPVVDGLVDRTPYNYALRTETAIAPEFAADATVTALAQSESMIKLTFPKAITEYPEMDDIIQSYIIRAYNDDTNELISEKRVISQHYLGRGLDYDTYTVQYTGLNSSTNYRFEVVAVESYQKESQPLVIKADTKAFSTEGLTATFYANFDYAWDSDAFDFYNHNTANPITQTDGILQAMASNSSKAMVKDLTFANGTVETLITMNNSAANINGGIYLFASAAADEQDTISAYNVHADSSPGSKDLQIALYRFNGAYNGNLKSVVLTDYFADGNAKASVKLKVEVSSGILSAFVDDVCVFTYSVGSRSGSVGLRSHYAGSDFDYIRIYEYSTEYVAPDTANLEGLFTEAKSLLANTEVEGTDSYTGKNPYVTQETYVALESIVNTYDVDLIRAYERHVVQVEAILTDGIAQFNAGILQPSVAQVGDVRYATVAQAVADANGEIVKILKDTDEAITINADVTIDLAGCTLSSVTVAEGATLTLIDSATDDYQGEYGGAAVSGDVATFAEVDGKTYMVVSDSGVYSAHCYDVAITHISLKPAQDALGYKAQLLGDEVVQSHVKSLGFNLWVNDGSAKTYEKVATSVTLRLQNILAAGGGEMNIHATAFVSLAVGEETSLKTSAQQSTTMKDTLQTINAAWADYSEAKQAAVKELCDKFAVTKNWELTNIYPAEEIAPAT